MKKNLLLLILVIIITSCSSINERQSWNPEREKELNSRVLGKIFGNLKLEIYGSYDECGEWGGNHETFIVFRKNDSLFSEYSYFEKNCRNINKNEKTKTVNTILHINEKKEKQIVKYMSKLLEKSLKYEMPFHAGNHFGVKINSELIIKVHDTHKNWVEFEKLKKYILN